MSESTIKKYKVDFDKAELRYHGETYHWDADAEWHRISKHNSKKQYYVNPTDSDRQKKLVRYLDEILRQANEERKEATSPVSFIKLISTLKSNLITIVDINLIKQTGDRIREMTTRARPLRIVVHWIYISDTEREREGTVVRARIT